MAALTRNKSEKGFMLQSNPVLRRLSLVKEHAEVETCATYSGIINKTGYFLLMTVVGILIYCILNMTVFATGGVLMQMVIDEANPEQISYIRFAVPEVITGVVCVILTIVMPFVCAASIKATPVCGTAYCLSEGYVLAMFIFKFLGLRNVPTSIGLVALILTVMVVGAMGFLYVKRIVKVDRKFYMVLMSAVGAIIIGSILCVILSLIPFTRPLMADFTSNPVIGVIAGLISVILPALFLLSDFAVIENCVENRLPARYEWMASFGLAFTVIWLYLKILQLLVEILGNGKNK